MTIERKHSSMEIFCFARLTPKLMRTCQNNLINLCQLPKDWSMKQDLSDVQIGTYLGCLYQQRQQVCCRKLLLHSN
jgi:hypothetical protein